MVVKSVRGRRRYVSFSVPQDTCRDDVAAALGGAGPGLEKTKVITCRNGKAVVRCAPGDTPKVTVALATVLGDVRSLDTSGTLHALRGRDPDLAITGRRKH